MATAEFKNGPSLGGFALGGAAGLVALGVALVVGKLDIMPAAFIAAMVASVVGLILGLPAGSAPVRSEATPDASDAAPEAPVAAAVVADAPVPQGGPLRLAAPRDGKADDLKEIEGIGPALETLCHGLGFYHFDQIASWTEADVAWVDRNMARFKGRILRDKWVAQAQVIVTEGLEVFRERRKTNSY